MTQRELDQVIATQTGKPLGEIQRIGFSLVEPFYVSSITEDPDDPPDVLDWDDPDHLVPTATISSLDTFQD
ncbi:Hypothetical protein PBC10988_2610 [Planctomycetales bacterium 10988]|nr:Hypothetical protein PBC10988_2610 [Planctomycetales bacterium 10988]